MKSVVSEPYMQLWPEIYGGIAWALLKKHASKSILMRDMFQETVQYIFSRNTVLTWVELHSSY